MVDAPRLHRERRLHQPDGNRLFGHGGAGARSVRCANSLSEREGRAAYRKCLGPPDSDCACTGGHGIVSLHDFRPNKLYRARPKYTFAQGTFTYQAVVPADLAKIYNLNPLFTSGITGKGETIVVIEDSDVYSTTDWTTFRSTFGLSGYTWAASQRLIRILRRATTIVSTRASTVTMAKRFSMPNGRVRPHPTPQSNWRPVPIRLRLSAG